MIEFLLLLIALLLWLLLRPQRDWYVVEWRFCSEQELCSIAFPAPATAGFDKGTCAAHNLGLSARYRKWDQAHAFLKHADGGEIRIHQYVFANLDAARMRFDELREPFGEDFQKLYLWRIVARSRHKAVTLPPEKYSDKGGETLLQYPRHLWTNPRASFAEPTA